MKLEGFNSYRKKFEASQQARITQKLGNKEPPQTDDLSKKLGIPYLSFDMMDPRSLKNEIDEGKA